MGHEIIPAWLSRLCWEYFRGAGGRQLDPLAICGALTSLNAVKALQLDNTLGEAHTSLAFCLDVFDWDLASADREFRRAIELNPGYATAHHWYAWHLSLLGGNEIGSCW